MAEEPASNPQLVVARQVYPQRLPIVVLSGRPVFPKTVTPHALTTPSALSAVKAAADSENNLVGLVLGRATQSDDEPPTELHDVGVVAQLLRAEPNEQTNVPTALFGALDRFRVERVLTRDPHVVAEVRYLYEEKPPASDELKAYGLAVINYVKELVQLNPLFKEELKLLVSQGSVEEPGRLADYAAFLTSAKGEQLQEVLEMLDVRQRLELVAGLLRRELDISKLQADIRAQIEERVSAQQREFFLREQLKAIKKELGLEQDDKGAQISRFLERLETRTPSDEARRRIDEEVEKLRLIDASSPEYNLTRNYVDWLTALPWGSGTAGEVTLDGARTALEGTHYGLGDVKERILEFIATGIARGSFAGSIICLVGPPGVGKTSIGKSVAEALSRKFYRFSLGGMRDEAEVKGHRRTYIGAMPGKFVQALRTCEANDPVIMLDEIDKVGASFRGDPAAALLEALDPEQNAEFLDHYLDVRFDLSNVFFIATANQLDTIPPPLLDRMEIIKLAGYLAEEKVEIAKRHLIPRKLKPLELSKRDMTITVRALREIVDGYARDAGLRSLDKCLDKIIRKGVVRRLEGAERVKVDAADVAELLGPRPFRDDAELATPRSGVVTGLAWTSMGGDTLSIEATAVRTGRASFEQTGQLGKVMVESSRIAYTTVRALCEGTGEEPGFFDEHHVHLHVPAGATPKDGPSAGVTMGIALYTLAHGTAVKPRIAMTGELNLSGHVLPVGGIKEKLLAAKRARVKTVLLPEDNRGDYERLPENVKKGLKVHFVAEFARAIELAVRG